MIEPKILRSELLTRVGVPHGFTTRQGGVSAGPYASLNFGSPWDIPADQRDPAASIERNIARLQDLLGVPDRTLVQVHQVHGPTVVVVRPGNALPCPDPAPKADAIVSDHPGTLIGVRVADCAPILLASADGRLVAAVHAGWRGVIAGVLPAAVRTMRLSGAEELVAAIGPCIGSGAFEVGDEVEAEFAAHFGAETAHRLGIIKPAGCCGWAKPHIDLAAALREQLCRCEVPGSSIEVAARCTFGEPDMFFSHRREAGVTGRMLAVIGPRG